MHWAGWSGAGFEGYEVREKRAGKMVFGVVSGWGRAGFLWGRTGEIVKHDPLWYEKK